MRTVPDFEADESLTPKQKARRRYYYKFRQDAIDKSVEWVAGHLEQYKKSAAKSRDKHREKIRTESRERARKRRRDNPNYEKDYYRANKEAYAIRSRRSAQKRRMDVIMHYGGRCVCCGENQAEFLSIDHVNNDGAAERKSKDAVGTRFYAMIQRLGYPKDRYRILCYNCNCALGFYGYCPHEKHTAELFGIPHKTRKVERKRQPEAA